MKTLVKIVSTVITSTLLALSAHAGAIVASANYNQYATGGSTNGNLSTASWAIIGNNSANAGIPVVTYINGVEPTATGAKVQFFRITDQVGVNGTNTTVTIPVVITNGFGVGDSIVIRHMANDTYERRVVTTLTTSNALVLTQAPTTTTVPGDIVYRATNNLAGNIPLSTNTVTTKNEITLSGPGIYSGQRGLPLLIELQGGTANSVLLNSVNAVIVP